MKKLVDPRPANAPKNANALVHEDTCTGKRKVLFAPGTRPMTPPKEK